MEFGDNGTDLYANFPGDIAGAGFSAHRGTGKTGGDGGGVRKEIPHLVYRMIDGEALIEARLWLPGGQVFSSGGRCCDRGRRWTHCHGRSGGPAVAGAGR